MRAWAVFAFVVCACTRGTPGFEPDASRADAHVITAKVTTLPDASLQLPWEEVSIIHWSWDLRDTLRVFPDGRVRFVRPAQSSDGGPGPIVGEARLAPNELLLVDRAARALAERPEREWAQSETSDSGWVVRLTAPTTTRREDAGQLANPDGFLLTLGATLRRKFMDRR